MAEKVEASAGEIFRAIPRVMADLGAVGKGQRNQSQGFNFRGIDDVYNALHKILAKHKVFTVPTIIGRERAVWETSRGGKGWHVVTSFRFRFYASDGSYVEADADGESLDTGDKGANKCASAAHKYALLQTFCIPTQDLDEGDRDSPELSSGGGEPVQMTAPNNPGGISSKQLNRLWAIGRSASLNQSDVTRYCKQQVGAEPQALTRTQYDQVCNGLEGKS